ncbi:MAG: heme exporter protein CcmB [Acidimicrobiales bacterium]
MWRDALAVAGKDLRVELRSRVATSQVLPFALVILVLLAFAIDPDSGLLSRAAPGLYWVAVTFAAVLAVQRSFSLESVDGAADGMRMSGLDPAGIFLGKAAAVGVQLCLLEAVLAVGSAILYNAPLRGPALLLGAGVAATVGLAAAGVLYGVLASSLRVRETLLPLLLLPVLAPVLLAATKAWGAAMSGGAGLGGRWLQLLAVFAVVYLAAGVLAFGPLLEVS